MSEWLKSNWQYAIDHAFRTAELPVRASNPQAWTFNLSDEQEFHGIGRLEEPWFAIDIKPVGMSARPPLYSSNAWETLTRSSNLPGAHKAVLLHDSTIALRLEIPLIEQLDIAAFLVEQMQMVGSAFRLLEDGISEQPHAAESSGCRPLSSLDETTRESLLRASVETGWEFIDRDGSLIVQLEERGRVVPAVIRRASDGGLCAATDLVATEELPEPCRQAIGMLLLRSNGIMRMIRSSVRATRDGMTVGLVGPISAVSGALLHEVCSALSIGLRLCRKEVNALSDEAAAQEYLKVWNDEMLGKAQAGS